LAHVIISLDTSASGHAAILSVIEYLIVTVSPEAHIKVTVENVGLIGLNSLSKE
jgi:hypothetical protein